MVILGRQPALGLAELESLYGPEKLQPFGLGGALLDIDPSDIAFPRLGGAIKLCRVLTPLSTIDWPEIEAHLAKTIPTHLKHVPDGKLKIGLSVYGLNVPPREINATGLRLKKIIKAEGRSVRVVPNKATSLSSAQVLYNQLTSPTGWELVIVSDGKSAYLAQTVAEQDIDAYAKRDQMRPMRDAKVGMLPPKLAQLLINLAVPSPGSRILDPFCGTGVVLQEAALMGFNYLGTDIEPRMVEYSEANLKWLVTSHNLKGGLGQVEIGDATSYTWDHPIDAVVCETYLGKPLTSLPPKHALQKIIDECEAVNEQFLRNIAEQLTPGIRLVLGVPAWRSKTGFIHLKTLAKLDSLGYTRRSFVHAKTPELVYHREGQVVARELVVLEKK